MTESASAASERRKKSASGRTKAVPLDVIPAAAKPAAARKAAKPEAAATPAKAVVTPPVAPPARKDEAPPKPTRTKTAAARPVADAIAAEPTATEPVRSVAAREESAKPVTPKAEAPAKREALAKPAKSNAGVTAPPSAAIPAEPESVSPSGVAEAASPPPVAPELRPTETKAPEARPPERRSGPPGGPIVVPRAPAKAEIFQEGDHVVYPTHGVGKVERIVTEEIAGHRLELIHITFEENRMTLRVPVAKARTAGLRKLASRKLFDDALGALKGKARIKRTMWSRRAQEYEAKINSGDPLAVAEVVRDLHRNAGQPDQSFSERQIYEAAMDRLAAELAALDKTDKPTAAQKLVDFLKTV